MLLLAVSLPATVAASGAEARTRKHVPKVLLVGEFHGKKGRYHSIQEAVNAAKEGDWILVGPGDYKEANANPIPGGMGDDRAPADILVRTPNLHIRGMDRNTVMIDGTKPGSPRVQLRGSRPGVRGPRRRRLPGEQRRGRVQGQRRRRCRTSRPATSSAPTTAATRSGSTAEARPANRRSVRGGVNTSAPPRPTGAVPKSRPTSTGSTRPTRPVRATSSTPTPTTCPTPATTSAPARTATRRIDEGTRRRQRPRLFGVELGRSPGDRELRLQATTRRASRPRARTTTTPHRPRKACARKAKTNPDIPPPAPSARTSAG